LLQSYYGYVTNRLQKSLIFTGFCNPFVTYLCYIQGMAGRLIKVEVSYPGTLISRGSYRSRSKNGTNYVIKEARQWMRGLEWTLAPYHMESWQLPLEVTCDSIFQEVESAQFSNPDNLKDCILETIWSVTGIKDLEVHWLAGNINRGDRTALLLTIKEA